MKKEIVAGTLLILLACSQTPEVEKQADLSKIKENRAGLDYGFQETRSKYLEKADALLQEWATAFARREHAITASVEKDLHELVRAYFSEIVESLRHGDLQSKIIASAALGFAQDVRAVPYLIEALGESDPVIRANAAMSLGHIASPDTPIPPMLRALEEDPVARVRGKAAFALSRIITQEKDWGTLPHLLKALRDIDPEVRNHVIVALGVIGNPEGAKAIVSHTITDENTTVRYNSVRTLGKIGSDIALGPLVERLRDTEEIVRLAAYLVLKKLTGKDLGPKPEEWENWLH